MKIYDSVLPNIWEVERFFRSQDYTGVRNPVDGVVYPDVTTAMPPHIVEDIEEALGYRIHVNTIFARLTCKHTGTAPHQAHNDISMGTHTLILYLQDGPGGTDFVRHKIHGMAHGPQTHTEETIWRADTNVYDAWEVIASVPMKRNRALVFHSEHMHRAEPIEGFGTGPDDGRIVLTIFFDRK